MQTGKSNCFISYNKLGPFSKLATSYLEDDGHSAMVRSSTDPAKWYPVNGSCPCDASHFEKTQPCKHRFAVRLYEKVSERLAEDEERYAPVVPAPEEGSAAASAIRAQYVTMIQGKSFVRLEGLLALAHESGLVELSTTIVSASADLTVCQATARFQDGRIFTDIGDASPSNVAKHLAPHFIRMAATRASARALRRALNIAACSLEELGGDE